MGDTHYLKRYKKLQCPQCQSIESKVIESRDLRGGEAIRRRRECLSCARRFTTYERIERPNLCVIKKDGKRQLFDRQKLYAGLSRAVEKRPVSNIQLEELISGIERDLHSSGEAEISSTDIGQMVMDRLAKIDDVAYVRFASVYRQFKDIDSFQKELNRLKARV